MKKIILITSLFLIVICRCYNQEIVDKPLTINEQGLNSDTLQSIDKMIQQAIADSAFPGAVFLASQNGSIVHHKPYGNFTYSDDSKKVRKNTIYDLASITKVFSTTSAAMILYERGKLDLEEKAAYYLPEFGQNGKDEIKIKHLLTHTSGLPSWGKLWQKGTDSLEIMQNLFSLDLENPVGTKSIYSCLGFITLGKIIEKISHQPLDEFINENMCAPLGLKSTFYKPGQEYFHRIPPTEIVGIRGGLIHGTVHDENAYFLGGVAGNAGLFSTAKDLFIFGQLMLNKGIYNGIRIFQPETIEIFLKPQNIVEDNSHRLGWDTPSGHSSSGHYFSDSSFGHNGFTGTSIWIDPHKKLIGILLTNRVYPTRENRKMYPIRPQIYDKLQQAVSGYELQKNPNVMQD